MCAWVCGYVCGTQASRRMFEVLKSNDVKVPVIHHMRFDDSFDRDGIVIHSGSCAGALMVDGMGDGVMVCSLLPARLSLPLPLRTHGSSPASAEA